MSDISKLGGFSIGWNYGNMNESLKHTDSIYIDQEDADGTNLVAFNATKAKWIVEELQKVVDKIGRYEQYLELKKEFEGE